MFAEQELLDAHARGDHRALVDLYLTAGELKEGSNPDAAGTVHDALELRGEKGLN